MEPEEFSFQREIRDFLERNFVKSCKELKPDSLYILMTLEDTAITVEVQQPMGYLCKTGSSDPVFHESIEEILSTYSEKYKARIFAYMTEKLQGLKEDPLASEPRK